MMTAKRGRGGPVGVDFDSDQDGNVVGEATVLRRHERDALVSRGRHLEVTGYGIWVMGSAGVSS